MTCGRNSRTAATSGAAAVSSGLDGEAALGQRRQRVAFGQAGVDETEESLLHPEDLAGPVHLGPAHGRQVRADLGPFHCLVQDVAALAAGQRADQDLGPLAHVPGHRGRALARLIVGMGMHRHQPELPAAGAARHLAARIAMARRSEHEQSTFSVSSLDNAGCQL